MSFGIFSVPPAVNEKVRSYAPGSPEALSLQQTLQELRSRSVEVPMIIGGREVHSKQTRRMAPPHDHAHTLGHFHEGSAEHVDSAIEAALAAKPAWEALPWEQRAAVFLRMADLLAGPYRDLINASTMLAQSKNPYQAEIDAACELIDFFRFNVRYMTEIYRQQPESLPGSWNRVEYRPLEGFVFALTPFNFTSIAANLPCSAALMGNTVVWKPANTQVYSAYWLMRLFREAGLPDGVINMVPVPGPVAGEVIFKHPDFAGIHFTGSSGVFNQIWEQIGRNIGSYKSYPRIVGETGGKDFVVAHASAPADVVATALSRGAFEYQGQKCSAASRAYVPDVLWPEVLKRVRADLQHMKMGGVEDFSNFINAVIDEKSFDKLKAAIDEAKQHPDCEVLVGGGCDKSKGYFVEPTLIQTTNPKYRTMCEELFGPVLTVYVYPADRYEEVLELCNNTSPYALTGAVLATDRYALDLATAKLRHAAGNFYLNDKPTGAVVGQQPFGGARASGTNDKAGSSLNLLRWVSARTIKENLLPPTTYPYPFQG
jgi:1-pyrroline-5-carboxylate dehydrogenase